jgi:hypothetical protein
MKTMIKSTIRTAVLCLSATVIIAGATSCKKNSSESSKAELLTKSAWKLTKEEYKTGTAAWLTNTIDACSADDLEIYSANGTVEFNAGAIKCSPGELQSQTANWNFENNESQLKVTNQLGSYVGNIEQLDANTLTISYSDDNNGVIEYFRSTYSH